MAPLINYAVHLAHRLFCRQGETLPTYSYLSRSFNVVCEAACAPQRARFEAHRFSVALLAKENTISGKARHARICHRRAR